MHTCQVPLPVCAALEPVAIIDNQVLQIKFGHLQYMNQTVATELLHVITTQILSHISTVRPLLTSKNLATAHLAVLCVLWNICSFRVLEVMELCEPVFTAALSTERPTQFCHGISFSSKVELILLKMTSAVPHLVPLVVHIPRKRWTTWSFIKIRKVKGFNFSTPAMTAYKHAKPPILLYRLLKTKSCQIIVEEKNIMLNGLPVSFDPSVMRVYGPSLICTTNSFMKCGASASLTIHEVLVLGHLYSLAVLKSLKHRRWSATASGTNVAAILTSALLVCKKKKY